MNNQFYRNRWILLLMTTITIVGGYFFLRLAYRIADSYPFTQEIVLICLGTIATILITAMLLNKQTSVEIEKEHSIRFLELKSKTYEGLISLIEEMALADEITERDLTRLQYVTHRLAVFASPAVLQEYQHFLETMRHMVKNKTLKDDDDELANALGRLTVKVRQDLLGELDSSSNYSQADISAMIIRNADDSGDIHL